MQVFQELTIRGTPEQIAATAEGICARIAPPWSRNAQLEERFRTELLLAKRVHCFDRAERDAIRAATVFLVQQDESVFKVVNIVPDESPELNYSQYNALLTEFTESFVRPAANEVGAHVDLTPSDVDIEFWLDSAAARKLRAFCTVANKRTGSRNPTDKRFWFDFVVAAHQSNSRLDSSTLARWLHEVGGWDGETADELAIQYERERGVLAHAQGLAVGA
jgi:hypothetical protein